MFGNPMNNSTATIFPIEMAERKAAELRMDDADWTYTVVANPKDATKAMIEIHDEDGEFVGRI